jgi:hypothetical protein
MDLSDPTRAVTATLDGPVLAALALAGRPMTVGQVAEQTARGSEIGVRRSLARLVEQGIVRATTMGRNQVHELNREHVAAPIAELLAGLRTELWRRFRAELEGWTPRPVYAAVFGSAARGDGDTSSDVDLLLVHPFFPGERRTSAKRSFGESEVPRLSAVDEETWHANVDRLRELVQGWTGNALQVVDLSFHEWNRPTKTVASLVAEVRRDGIELVDPPPLVSFVDVLNVRG